MLRSGRDASTRQPVDSHVPVAGPRWQRPPVDGDHRVVFGVASGLARELGLDRLHVRIGFVVLSILAGWGVLLYVGAWLIMRGVSPQGYQPQPKAKTEAHRTVAFLLVVVGLVAVASELTNLLSEAVVWPSVLIGVAVAIVWYRGDGDQGAAGWAGADMIAPRVLIGSAALLAAAIVALALSVSFWQAVGGIVIACCVLGGSLVLLAPVIANLGNDLVDERHRRIRVEERAAVAAHLHDSVLQTLTLIQKRSDDSEVVGLARRQERELRAWLFGDRGFRPDLGFRSELERQLAEVEAIHGIPVEVVAVGDTAVDATVHGLIQAAREAATNACKHSGAERVDVYAEVDDDEASVFVRDQGKGFDPAAVSPDRHGIRDSIVARMERHGGSATVHSEVGAGTEVEMAVPLR